MTAVGIRGKGVFQNGQFNSTLNKVIAANFSAPAVNQQVQAFVEVDLIVKGWQIAMLASGSIVVDIWRKSITESAGVFTPPTLPTSAASIAGTYLPTLTAASIAQGGNIPGYPPNPSSLFELGWGGAGAATNAGTLLYAGDWLIFNVNSYTAGGAGIVQLFCDQGS
jgi:hypothetical protein